MTILDIVANDIIHVEAKMRENIGEPIPALNEVIAYLISAGGKRLRPAITLLVTRFGNVDMKKAIALAASVEMLHTATLVHDDFVDNANARRGHPTLNTKWAPAATVLAGDYMFARSAALAAETDNVRIVKIFSTTLMTIVNGELQQFFSRESNVMLNRDEYFNRIYAKTASLFTTCAETGAILAGLLEHEMHAFRDYGYQLGMAFQIMDDILDFQGDEKRIGKPVAHDLRQGIITLPILDFLDVYPDHSIISKVITGKTVTDNEIQETVKQLRTSNALQQSLSTAKEFVGKAESALAMLPDNIYRKALSDIAHYAVARNI
ncbi:MAG: hypothetical protein B6242_12850 [Anaerolineaceae bacterium 4572_78]|nr:MAG: hypothetical protein B6242_12850 [Anaerolineaceae bacterium 4572_78]